MDTTVVVSVLSTLAFAAVEIGAYRAVSHIKALLTLPATLKRLADAAEGHGQNLGGYMAGLVKVCEANVAQYEKLTAAIEKFSALVVAPGKDELTTYDEGIADRSYRTQQYMAEGLTKANAETRADADIAEKIFANSIGVVD